jgi:hypothetical protein
VGVVAIVLSLTFNFVIILLLVDFLVNSMVSVLFAFIVISQSSKYFSIMLRCN